MKLIGHILILFFLFCSLKTFADERLVDQLPQGPVEVLVDQESGKITVDSYAVDGMFLIEKMNFTKGGEDSKAPVSIIVDGDKMIIDLRQVRGLTFMSGNILKVKELADFILSGNAVVDQTNNEVSQGGGTTGTHGGGK